MECLAMVLLSPQHDLNHNLKVPTNSIYIIHTDLMNPASLGQVCISKCPDSNKPVSDQNELN